ASYNSTIGLPLSQPQHTRTNGSINILRDSKQNLKVPRESIYDAELYQTLFNWFVKVDGFEITSQWHLERIHADDDLYATSSIPKLKDHFNSVFKYAELLHPLEVWVVHFSCKEDVTKKTLLAV
ncbi:19803_t:CDS:2, partial [Gigaspora rosea]